MHALRDHDAGWQAAEALAGALGTALEIIDKLYDQQAMSDDSQLPLIAQLTEVLASTVAARAPYTAARAARGTA